MQPTFPLEDCGCEACIGERTTKAERESLDSPEADLTKVKKLQIACFRCEKVGQISISDTMEMDTGFYWFAKDHLRDWAKNHCKYTD